jgi:type IV pilus assembly protein PilN
VAVLKKQVDAANAEQNKYNAVIHKPENETVLFGSYFINTLLLRKGISWNQIFSDLEKTLPYNVKLTRIRPTVNDQGHVTLDLTLASDKDSGLVEALKAFASEPKYGAVEYKNITPPSQSEPLYRLALDVTYAEKL